MDAAKSRKAKVNRFDRIKAATAARNMPTAILLKKKVECDAKALKIVERLMEPGVDVEWMLESLGQINCSHMEDVADERAIGKLCGYVLCDNELTKVVTKKYQISTLRNKVYDVEKTKNYCSFTCYTAMNHLMLQMLTSPLWLRSEEEIPHFTIFERCKNRSHSPPGVEVNITGIDLPVDDDTHNDDRARSNVKEIEKEICAKMLKDNEINLKELKISERKVNYYENEQNFEKSNVKNLKNSEIETREKIEINERKYDNNC